MESVSELSKSRLFAVVDGTVVIADQANSVIDQPDRLPGMVIDNKYRIIGLLGKGGMGAVYSAHHLMLDKEVALKTFGSAAMSEEACRRFQREAQAIAKLNHKNVVQIFDFGLSDGGVPYYTMEYIRGESLADRLHKNGPVALDKTIALFIQICQGLSIAHGKGIIHRDLKPANIFIEITPSPTGGSETAKIVDFGIASLTDQSQDGQKITASGTIFGSPLYMSPEQSTGQNVTASADIYSLGCALFEALTGKPPFRGGNAIETIMLHHSARVPSLQEASGSSDYPDALEQLLSGMLAKSPGDRPSDIDQVAADLSRIISRQVKLDSRSSGITRPLLVKPDDSTAAQPTKTKAAPDRHPWVLLLTAAAAIFFMGLVGYAYIQGTDKSKQTPVQALLKSNVSQTSSQTTGQTTSQKTITNTFKPVRHIEKGPTGKDYVVFTFAPGLDIGTIKVTGNKGEEIHCRGEIKRPKNCPIFFEPSQAFLQNPANLEVFQPDDLCALIMADCPVAENQLAVMHQICSLTKLQILDLQGSRIADLDLSELKNLRILASINVDGTNIDGTTLANLPQLKQLSGICFSRCKGASALLAADRNSQRLRSLFLDEDRLTPADFRAISTMSNLETLQVHDSGMTDQDLAALASLKRLKTLDALNCPITPAAIETLKAMSKNGLRELKLTGSGWSSTDRQVVSQLIRGGWFANDLSKRTGVESTSDLENMFR